MPATTIPELLRDAAAKFGDRVALRQPDGKEVHTWTWNDYLRAAEEVAAGLKALGIEKGDHVALCSETRAEFYLADLGILTNGSVAAALYPSYPAEDLKRTIAMADAKALFVEDFRMLQKLGNLAELNLRLVVVLKGEVPPSTSGGAISMSALRTHGRYVASISGEDNAILYLTSGATGEPKMVMVTHSAIVSNIHAGPAVLPLDENDITIAFLPSAHIAQRVVIEILPILSATAVSFAEGLAKLQQEIKAVRPTWFLAPPRVWERAYTSIRAEILKKPALAQKAFFAALGLGLGAAKYKREGKPVPWRISFPLQIANRFIFAKIRERFGGRLRVAASGAAPLGSDLCEFYEAVGMPLIEGYGLTEGGVTTLNPLDAPRPGSIGKSMPHVEFKVSEDEGELLIRGGSISKGYYKDPEATAELLRDGWLHTGDIGTIDSEGYIYITGRKKELIVASNGKKIFPSRVEAMFKFEPLVSQVMLLGDRLPHLVALFTINAPIAEAIEGAKESGKELHEAPPVIAEVQAIVNRINKQLAPFEQVKRFRILPREFSIDFGEVTATMKVRRQQVMENFKADVDALYQLSASGRGGE